MKAKPVVINGWMLVNMDEDKPNELLVFDSYQASEPCVFHSESHAEEFQRELIGVVSRRAKVQVTIEELGESDEQT